MRFRQHAGSFGTVLLTCVTLIVGAFDYLTNLISGRRLSPAQFSIFVAVMALLQIAVHATNVIRNIVAYYAAETPAQRPFLLRMMWHWAVRWGGLVTLLFILLTPLWQRWLNLTTPWPLIAAGPALLMLFLRPVTDGFLQGGQQFGRLAVVQATQAVVRVGGTVALIGLGWQATGAVLALPLATSCGCVVAWWWLREMWPREKIGRSPQISWRYSAETLIGLLAFALLTNSDMIIVKRSFSAELAAQYAALITLGKLNLFIPLALGMILFPKAVQRGREGRDPRPLLGLALAATLLLGTIVTLCFYWRGAEILALIFGDHYVGSAELLVWIGGGTTLLASLNIWLNYALSQQNRRFIIALAVCALLYAPILLSQTDSLPRIAITFFGMAALANVLALLTTRHHPAHQA